MKNLKTFNFKQILQSINAFIFDIDGVLSSNTININENFLRTINLKDSYILKKAVNSNINICIISENADNDLESYYKKMGINFISANYDNKLACVEEFMKGHKLDYSEILYMGDDFPDYEILEKVGLACCPADAANEIKNLCHYVSKFEGGKGCVRDIVEQVLRAKSLLK